MKKPLDVMLKAIGYTSKGKIIEFKIDNDGILHCYDKDLIRLEIPNGVKKVYCSNNLLTELILPKGVNKLYCRNNLLKELNIPNSVEELWCNNNKLTELDIPKSVTRLHCDMNIKGLDNIDWDCNIRLV